ncbi:uncharacterized protein LOC109824194 [Asparagus officinalis]|uniref:uncharacterized protein LOC109824194 n=1 Tax=Asparagus officinalis TaxID=4686 RepID=UPI00098E28CF|nr:uncharacterized protein LOC109824194 [Asparagus officinalis]
MYGEDVKERKGFQFDHVWTIHKDAEKWADHKSNHAVGSIFEGSESNTQSQPNATEDVMDLNTKSKSFMNMSDSQFPTDSPTSQHVGRKEKAKRKKSAGFSSDEGIIKSMQEMDAKREMSREKNRVIVDNET